MPLIGSLFDTVVQRYPDRVALLEDDSGARLTYRQLSQLVDHGAAALHRCGLDAGDRLALFARNSAYWVAVEVAAAKLGITVVPINVYLSAQELGRHLRDAAATGLVVDVALERQAEEAIGGLPIPLIGIPDGSTPGGSLRDVLPGTAYALAHPAPPIGSAVVDPASTHRLVFSSGTSGRPKQVHCSHELLVATTMTSLANQASDQLDGDRLLVTTPLTHFANSFLWAFLCRGNTSVVTRRFDAERCVAAIREHRITHLATAPTLIADLVRAVDDGTASGPDGAGGPDTEAPGLRAAEDWSLRAIWYAGSPMPAPLVQRATRVFGPVLNQQYGLTEAVGIFPATGITELTAAWHARKPGSCGRPVLGAVIRVLDDDGRPLGPGGVGEIAVLKGTTWQAGNATGAAAGPEWLLTGDIGTFDDDGFLYLVGRRSDMIISGGLNIYPGEVEDVLRAHPAVADCAVAGVPDERWIETPQALVVLRTDSSTTETELIGHCRDRLAHFKCPTRIVFATSLPTNSTGKVLRRDVVDALRGTSP